MNAWTWTVFQLMTQAAMNDHDKKIKDETSKFIGDLITGNVVHISSVYK